MSTDRLIDAVQLAATVRGTAARLEANPTGGVIRPWVEARLVRDVEVEITWEQFGREFTLRSDEPGGRGGGGTAPTAIRYFLTGVASCLQVWFAKGAALTGCELTSLILHVEAVLDMRIEYGLSPSGSTEQIVARATVESPSDEALVKSMADEAFRRCPLWNLVVRGIPGYRQISHNGRLILDTLPAERGGRASP